MFQRSAAAPTSIVRATAAASRSGCSNARTEVEPAVMRIRPSLSIRAAHPRPPARQRIGVGLQQRRRLDRDRLPRGAELVGDDLRQRGPDALPGLDLRHRDRDPAVARDLDEIAERLFAFPIGRSLRRWRGHSGEADDQADADAAADQQCPAVELQLRVLGLQRAPVDLAGAEARQRLIRER